MECGGLKGRNLQTLTEVDLVTRGGRDLFVWGLDANVEPEEWDTIKVGEKTWLEHMDAEIVTVSNSKFTCRGKQGQEGGSNIDYFIISRKLMPLVRLCEAVFESPWGPHFGLKLHAKPSEVLLRILIQPNLPKEVLEMQKPKAQTRKPVIENKIDRQKVRNEEKEEDVSAIRKR